jgi:hypothetical protein
MKTNRAVLAAVLVALPSAGFAASATISIVGGKLPPGTGAGGTCWTDQTRDHVLVVGLPQNWSAGAGQCHTAVLGQYPKLAFGFSSGVATTASLKAQGYVFTAGQFGLPPAPTLTLCRGAGGKVDTLNVQISMYKGESGGIFLFQVGAANSSRTAGSSEVSSAGVAGGNGISCLSESTLPNRVDVVN